MADAEDKTVVQPEDRAEGKAEEKAEEKAEGKATTESSGGSKKMIMFGLVGVGAIVMGVVLAIFVLKPMLSNNPDEEAEKEKKPAVTKKKESGSHQEPTFYAVKNIVVNPAGTGGTRFLSVSFAFQLDSPELAAEMESKEIIVRDILITILSAKTVAQLTDPKQKEIVRYQIKKRVTELLKTEELAAVYYTDFVLQ